MDRFREIGLKLTPQRLAVLQYLDGNTSHPSAEDIFDEAKKKFPTMSFATVYNILEALKNRGYVQELIIDPKRKRYDPDTSTHHHLICQSCSKIRDVHKVFDLTLPDDLKNSFDIKKKHVEFYGICPECKKKSP
jgi:Fur family peroxide stress response transcriptional regulator